MLQNLKNFSAWLLPRICVGCGFEAEDSELDLCAICKRNLPWLDAGCYQCGGLISKPNESIICVNCQSIPPAYSRLCALFKYRPPVTRMIGSLKFGQQLYPGALFGNLLSEAILETWYVGKVLPQIIIPVPLHIKRQRLRGYNQATEIALPISKNLSINLDLNLCTRIKNTKPQARLDKINRLRNLDSAFIVNSDHAYKHVALVDDVVTTGSTINAISRALLKSGVDNIDVWCVCKA